MTPQEITSRFIDPWLNKIAIAPRFVIPVFACAIGYHVSPLDNRGGGWGARFWLGRIANEKVFYNSAFFFRFMLPFYFGIGIRWAGRNPTKREFLQCYIGWKLNGFFSVVFRAQSDISAAEGFTAPNPNLAIGWEDGPK